MSEEDKKPAAIITINRLTSQEESVQVSVNANELTVDSIYEAITCAGEALRKRVIFNNEHLADLVKDSIPAMKITKGGRC